MSSGWQQSQTLVQEQLHSELLLCLALYCAEQVKVQVRGVAQVSQLQR